MEKRWSKFIQEEVNLRARVKRIYKDMPVPSVKIKPLTLDHD